LKLALKISNSVANHSPQQQLTDHERGQKESGYIEGKRHMLQLTAVLSMEDKFLNPGKQQKNE
jgi:hypothetical protein